MADAARVTGTRSPVNHIRSDGRRNPRADVQRSNIRKTNRRRTGLCSPRCRGPSGQQYTCGVNEEEVKNNVVIPWLIAQGVPQAELHFERPFRVRLGRHIVVAGQGDTGPVATGRLDILVSRQGRHLLIVEVKAETLALTDDDRDQGISYAKLVDPVAPFVLVTNGRESRLYETLTKNLVSDSTIVHREYTVSLPERDRIEALQLFLASSPANVLRLSAAQIEKETATLKGPPTDLGAVYISPAHYPNTALLAEVRRFLQSTSSLFVIVGEAGSGKTSASVDVAASLLAEGYPTFFYQAGMLESDVLEAVWRELAWAFNEQSDRVRALRHLSHQGSGKPFVIVLDALDEWTHEKRAKHLRWLAQHIDPVKTRIVATCKEAAWAGFLAVRDQRTGIDRYTYEARSGKQYSVALGPLSHKDFHEVLRRYRSAFGVSGGIDLPAQDAGRRNLFLLRLMFQVAAATGKDDITLYSSDLFKRYLELAVSRTESAQASIAVLRATAGLMFDRNTDWVEEDDLRAALQLRPTERLPDGLFLNRLLNHTGPVGSRRITFTFAQLRSYLIAFYARKWDRMNVANFDTEMKNIQGLVRSEAVGLYYSVASQAHQRVLEGPIRENATTYLHRYLNLIAEHFPAAREAFLPYTKGAIGIGATLRIQRRRVDMFGFRPRSNDEPEVLIIPVEASDDHAALSWLDIERGYGGAPADAFTTGDIGKYVLVHEIGRQVKEIVEDMMLTETPPLAREAVAFALSEHSEQFSRLMQPGRRREPAYPVSIASIRDEYRRNALRAEFREDVVQEKRARGEIEEQWKGSTVSYSLNLTPTERAEIESRVDRAMLSGESPISKVTLVDSVRMWRRVSRSLDELETEGFTHVEEPFKFQEAAISGEGTERVQLAEFRRYCQRLLELVLSSYISMVQTNFPTLANHFRRYAALPATLVLALPQTDDACGRLYFCGGAARNEVHIFAAGEVIERSRQVPEDRTGIDTPSGRHAWFLSQNVTEANLISGPSTSRSGKWRPAGVVRRWVYSWLNDELDGALLALLASAGISRETAADAGLHLSSW